MKKIKKIVLAVLLFSVFIAVGKETVIIFNPLQLDDKITDGKILNDIISAELSCADGLKLVERKQLNKLLAEKSLSTNGMLEPQDVSDIGTLLGADYFVSGSIRNFDKKWLLFIKTVSIKTGIVKMKYFSTPGNAMEETGQKAVAEIITLLKNQQKYPNKTTTQELLFPDKKRPVVAVFLPELHIFRENLIDPAAENMITKLLLQQKFIVKQLPHQLLTGQKGILQKLSGDRKTLLKIAKEQNVEFLIYGEAIAENADRFGNFNTARARVEIKVISTKTSEIHFADSAYAGAMDTAPVIAGKIAIQKATQKIFQPLAKSLLK